MNGQIEAIRNEIKRLEEIHERNLKKPMERGRIGFAHGVVACCDRILAFIDSLPEGPDNEESNRPKLSDTLEEAAEKYTDSSEWLIGENIEHIDAAFIAGAEWQKSQMMKDGNVILAEEDFDVEKEKSMEWGYNLCKEQMLKDAVEGEARVGHPFSKPFIEVDLERSSAKWYNMMKKFMNGDKVRILIMKEDK